MVATNTNFTIPYGNQPPPKPYLNYCQACSVQGHTTKRCPTYQIIPPTSTLTLATLPSPPWKSHLHTWWQPRPQAQWQPHANFPSLNNSYTLNWLIDSGVSHHVTSKSYSLWQLQRHCDWWWHGSSHHPYWFHLSLYTLSYIFLK